MPRSRYGPDYWDRLLAAALTATAAALIAGFTGLTYAELAARVPRSAGEALYVQEGLGWLPLSTLLGLLIVLTIEA